MPVPTHNTTCETKLWETRCPACAAVVYFFSCSCGSKVFFDLPHPPWDPHEHTCIAYLISYLRDVEGYSPAMIWERVVDHANTQGIAIPAGTRQQVFGPPPRGQSRIRPLEIQPTDQDEVRVDGQIMRIDAVNFFRRFDLVDNPVGQAILGDLAKQPYMEVTLREDHDEETGYSNQYKFFVRQAEVARLGLRQSARVTCILRVGRILHRRFWIDAASQVLDCPAKPEPVVKAIALLEGSETVSDHMRRTQQIIEAFNLLNTYLKENPDSEYQEYIENKKRSHIRTHLKCLSELDDPDEDTWLRNAILFIIAEREVKQVLNLLPHLKPWHERFGELGSESSKKPLEVFKKTYAEYFGHGR